MALQILFTRHGETQDNIDRVLQGHRDTSLTPNGHADATRLATKLTTLYPAGVHAVYHSPLLRIRQTIAPYLATYDSSGSSVQKPAIHSDADLMGQCLGALEGESYDAIDMSSPRSADAHESDGVEVFDKFVERLLRVFGRIVGAEAPKVAGGEDRVVVVATHGVGITSLFKALEASKPCDNFGPAVARRENEAWEVRWTDADDVARIVVQKPGEVPVKDGVVEWERVVGTPFAIEDWGKKEKAL